MIQNLLLRPKQSKLKCKSMRNLRFFPQPAKMSGESRRLPSDFLRLRNKNVALATVRKMGMLRKRTEFRT